MLNIRKISILVILLFLSLNVLEAQNEAAGKHYGFSLSPLAGILIGKSEEILYKYSYNDQYVSQLIWDLKPLIYVGLDVNFGRREPFEQNSFLAGASVKFGLPLKTGIMEDRDWQDKDYDYLTNYSRHDVYTQNAILLDLSAGYYWRVKDFLTIGVLGEFSYMYFSMMAENGYYQYAAKSGGNYIPWNDSIAKIPIYGAAIRYIQNWFIISPRISARGRLSRLFSVEGNIMYSPLVFCADRDDHLLLERLSYGSHQNLFYGYFYFGHYVNGNLGFTCSPAKNFDLSLSLSYRYITGLRNKTYYIRTGPGISGDSFENNYEGGAGFSAFDIEFAAKIRI